MRFLISAILFLCCNTWLAVEAQGQKAFIKDHSAKVLKVIDGDTFDVKDEDSSYRVRLFGIDAPEHGQDFFEESKQLLIQLTINNKIILDTKGKDRYGRTIATIIRQSDHLNINYQMVRMGLAWHYTRYSSDPILQKFEALAREKQIGIWSLFHYLEPWEYRKH